MSCDLCESDNDFCGCYTAEVDKKIKAISDDVEKILKFIEQQNDDLEKLRGCIESVLQEMIYVKVFITRFQNTIKEHIP